MQVEEFIHLVLRSKSLYGLQTETLDSLLLELLPPIDHHYQKLESKLSHQHEAIVEDDPFEIVVCLFQEILNALRNNAGFHVPKVSTLVIQLTIVATFFCMGLYQRQFTKAHINKLVIGIH